MHQLSVLMHLQAKTAESRLTQKISVLILNRFTYSLIMMPVLVVILPAVYFLIFRGITNDSREPERG